MTLRLTSILLAALLAAIARPAGAEACRPEDFAAAVDASGAALRAFNAQSQPALKAKLAKLAPKKGWGENEIEEKGLADLEDDRVAGFNARASDLLTKVDTLGRPDETGSTDCAQLAELKTAAADLLNVIKERSAYLDSKVDTELAASATPPAPAPDSTPAKPPAKTAAAAPAPRPAAGPPKATWNTTTSPEPLPGAPSANPPPLPPEAFVTGGEGYSINEIQDITRGFFGTISTGLATVIEHAFSVAGRPTAYVLGKEGGGAFLAGLRYGEGTLYMRSGGTAKVYWHGPSIGTDIGASGSRTLFLVYALKDPNDLYRAYTGLDGSAYLVGGVGITLMKGGDVVMAPIRSGLGLRIGANLGYLRFTSRPTWNPF